MIALSACAQTPPTPQPQIRAPHAWQAPRPQSGGVTGLAAWWSRFDDPLVATLVTAAQGASPTLASAASRIEQSRAARVAAQAALLPSVDASGSASRGRIDLSTPLATSLGATLQSSWELDLFGGNRAARDAAQARLEGSEADWRAAHVAVAAEVATAYIGLRACEAQQAQTEADAASRRETARLTELAMRAGFQSPAAAALARASAAQGNNQLVSQRASCDIALKGLVALTALDEPALREQLASRRATLPMPAQIDVPSVPGEAMAQRPDLQSSERALVAASADVGEADARRYPRITLGGSIGITRLRVEGQTFDGSTWAVGPLSVSLPLFDGGTTRANLAAARARYDDASAAYRGRLLQAVREVEEALVRLQSTADRAGDAQAAVEGYQASLRATEALNRGGLASLFELEDARRAAVTAQVAAIDLQRERIAAWVELYRALGGDGSQTALPVATR